MAEWLRRQKAKTCIQSLVETGFTVDEARAKWLVCSANTAREKVQILMAMGLTSAGARAELEKYSLEHDTGWFGTEGKPDRHSSKVTGNFDRWEEKWTRCERRNSINADEDSAIDELACFFEDDRPSDGPTLSGNIKRVEASKRRRHSKVERRLLEVNQ